MVEKQPNQFKRKTAQSFYEYKTLIVGLDVLQINNGDRCKTTLLLNRCDIVKLFM